MNASPKAVLYWSSTMLDNTANLDQQLEATGSSGFNDILLFALHVNQPVENRKDIVLGDLSWNETLLVSTQTGEAVFDPTNSFTKLEGRLKALVAAGKKIFFTIGSAPDPNHPERAGDFATIKELFSTFEGQDLLQNNFGLLLHELPSVTGFDFDVEDCFDVESTAWLTEVLAVKFKAAITYCPYEWDSPSGKPFWKPLLELVYQNLNTQPVAWFNLQCYSGGFGQIPTDWKKDIEADKDKNGVADPSTFIVPGYPANNKNGDARGICPSDFTTELTPYKGNVGGAFVWNSHNIFDIPAPCDGSIPSVNDYATAITNALQ